MSSSQAPVRRTRSDRCVVAFIGLAVAIVLGGCTSSSSPAAEPRPASPATEPTSPATATSVPVPVRTLAKVDDWRPHLVTPPVALSALEIAYDADTARLLWQDNVPADLPAQQGDPLQFGVYGDLGSVDFTDHVVALWSSGQSTGCPRWASTIYRADGGEFVVEEDVDTGGNDVCLDDRRVYRTVVVIERAQVPTMADLASWTADDGGSSFPRPVLLAAYARA